MLYFLLYNDGTHTEDMNRLIESVKQYGKGFQIIVFRKDEMDPEFRSKYKDILECKRGGGYWLWKPYIIHETLNAIDTNDIVFYLDSKYYFIDSFVDRVLQYTNEEELYLWKNKPNEPTYKMKHWCKMDAIIKYNMYDKVFQEEVHDAWAGCILVKKTERTSGWIQEWLTMCCDYQDITDSPSDHKNSEHFYDHRHDQSLLSILAHTHHIPLHTFEKSFLQNVRLPFK
jgi:hypothetical protein